MSAVPREFGDSRLLANNEDFFKQSPYQQAIELSISHGCPIPDDVIKAYGGGELGEKKAIERYAECNFIYRHCILPEVKEINPELYSKLSSDFVTDAGRILQGSETPWGYTIPRILIEAFGAEDEGRAERFNKALEIIGPVAKVSTSPEEFSAKLAAGALNCGTSRDKLISQLLPVELLSPYPCLSYLEKVLASTATHANILYLDYLGMSLTECRKGGIADLV
jgi:hypothetical protein